MFICVGCFRIYFEPFFSSQTYLLYFILLIQKINVCVFLGGDPDVWPGWGNSMIFFVFLGIIVGATLRGQRSLNVRADEIVASNAVTIAERAIANRRF